MVSNLEDFAVRRDTMLRCGFDNVIILITCFDHTFVNAYFVKIMMTTAHEIRIIRCLLLKQILNGLVYKTTKDNKIVFSTFHNSHFETHIYVWR